jgi:hypothetical protein
MESGDIAPGILSGATDLKLIQKFRLSYEDVWNNYMWFRGNG